MQVFNDLTRRKEELKPQHEGKFQIYVCGPTVYDFFHLGNARPFVVYDTLRRYLEYRGYDVEYVQNFTDVDDKVITRANAEGITCKELADRMIDEYFKDADGLNIKRATVHPRATETIDEIIAIIQDLMDKGHAYVNPDGVYFDIQSFPNYGKLSRHSLDDLMEGASQRLGQDRTKKNPFDFVLWKFKKEGEPYWASPWGDGRPGWHIECSAMSRKHLGKTIDIHCGGQDLIFPHHENEIAQSEAANGVPFVNYWMHNGFVNIDNEKMAKSAGNFFRVRDLVEHYDYDILRFFILQAHYRMPINFSKESLDAAEQGFERIKNCVSRLDFLLEQDLEHPDKEASAKIEALAKQSKEHFIEAMDDDLNTAEAFASIFELVRETNGAINDGELTKEALTAAHDMIEELLGVLGLSAETEKDAVPADVTEMVQQRATAKAEKNWAEADRLRDAILAAGYHVEDTPQGPKLVPVEED